MPREIPDVGADLLLGLGGEAIEGGGEIGRRPALPLDAEVAGVNESHAVALGDRKRCGGVSRGRKAPRRRDGERHGHQDRREEAEGKPDESSRSHGGILGAEGIFAPRIPDPLDEKAYRARATRRSRRSRMPAAPTRSMTAPWAVFGSISGTAPGVEVT